MDPNYAVPTFPAEMPIDPSQTAAMGLFFAGFGLVMMVFGIAFYVYLAICLMKIAQKTGVADGWWAWIPILNVFLMLKVAKEPLWWFLLMLIPLVNIIIGIIVWMKIAEAVGKPSYWGILMILPVLNLIAPGYLAFSSGGPAVQATPPAPVAVQ